MDPTCGAFSNVFSFSLHLGVLPEFQTFITHTIMENLQYCLKHQVIHMFPTFTTAITEGSFELLYDINTETKWRNFKDNYPT
jgi:hypothetical protein